MGSSWIAGGCRGLKIDFKCVGKKSPPKENVASEVLVDLMTQDKVGDQ
jgi:hypothetical protein